MIYGVEVKQVQINNGVLDLSSRDFINEIYEFNGDVWFYHQTFIHPSQIKHSSTSRQSINTTKSWNNQNTDEDYIPTFSFGTYHFTVKLPASMHGETVIIRPNHFIAYASRLYVNGKEAASNGSVGQSKGDVRYEASRMMVVDPVLVENTTLDIVIHVANFDHFRGGIFDDIHIGKAEDMIIDYQRNILFDLGVIISLIIMFLYHFVLYFVNTKETVSLYFSLTALIFAVDFSFQDTMTFFVLFPEAGFRLSSFLHLSMPYLLPSSFMFFLSALFPQDVSKRFRNFTAIASMTLVAITLFFGSSTSSFFAKPHFLYIIGVVFYVLVVAVRAAILKREGAWFFLVAYLLFSVFALNDILFVFEIIHTRSLVSTGLVLFIFLLSILQGRRTLVMYNRNLLLSDNLTQLNQELENKVEQRTTKLRKLLMQLKDLNGFKENMTYMLVHDLKTPLNTIINSDVLPSNERTMVVQQSGYYLLNLVENVLDVVKSDSSELQLRKAEVPFEALLANALKEISLSIKIHGLKVEIETQDNYLLNVDKELLHRVLVNLLSNAIKFSPRDGVITIRSKWTDDQLLEVSIANQGPAISKKDKENIFEQFFQSKEGQAKSGSTGLGLTFCKIAIEAHGGQIGVYSENEGAEFWFSIPEAMQSNSAYKARTTMDKDLEVLDKEDKIFLKELALQLKTIQPYDISEITKRINELDPTSQAALKWLRNVENAAYASDIKTYDSLIKMIFE